MPDNINDLSVADILAFLRKLNKHLRSRPVRAEIRRQTDSVREQHADLIWELNVLINKFRAMELADINQKLSVYSERLSRSTEDLKRDLEDLSRLRTTLNKAEKMIGVIARTALLFA